jgi:hypothetical protein
MGICEAALFHGAEHSVVVIMMMLCGGVLVCFMIDDEVCNNDDAIPWITRSIMIEVILLRRE